MTATAKDVAKLANVSPSTVSRVINNDKRISKETRDRVFKCIKKLDYKVNTIARSLKTNKTYTIGFVAPEISEEFFMRVAKGAEDYLSKFGYSLIICNANDSAKIEAEKIKLLHEKQVDGVIVVPSENNGKGFEILRKNNIPIVFADRYVDNFKADTVLVDNVNGTYRAIEYMIDKGANRIGFIGGTSELSNAKERYKGYLRAMEDYNILVDPDLLKFGDFHIKSGYELTKELLESKNPPRHLFVSNYYMHVGATQYLIEQQKIKEQNIQMASFDDMQLTALLGFASITVAQPIIEIGRTAAKMLLDRITGENTNKEYTITRLKPEFIYY